MFAWTAVKAITPMCIGTVFSCVASRSLGASQTRKPQKKDWIAASKLGSRTMETVLNQRMEQNFRRDAGPALLKADRQRSTARRFKLMPRSSARRLAYRAKLWNSARCFEVEGPRSRPRIDHENFLNAAGSFRW